MRRRDYYWSLYHSTEQNQIDNLRTDQVEAIYAAIPESMRDEWWIWRDGFESWKQFEDFPQLLLMLRHADAQVVLTPTPPRRSAPKRTARTRDAEAPEKSLVKEKPAPSAEKAKKESVSESRSETKTGATVTGTRMVRKESPGESRSDSRHAKGKTDAKQGWPVRFALEDDGEQVELSLLQAKRAEGRDHFRFERQIDVRIIVEGKTYANSSVNISLKGIQLKSALPSGLPRYFNVELHKKDRVIPLVCSEIRNSDGSPSNRVKIEVNDYAPALLSMLLAG